MSELRLGLVGAGLIADTHLASLDALGGASVRAVTDVDPARAERVAARTGATVRADVEALVEAGDLDAVLICTPPAHHREPALAALRARLPVYLEKPLARTLADGAAIRDAATASGLPFAVGYQWRALTFLDELRRVLDGQPLGLLAATGLGPAQGRSWFVHPAEGGGQLLERSSHHVDLQRALAGDVVAVQASGARVPLAGDDRPTESQIDDVLALTLRFGCGALGTVDQAWSRRGLGSRFALEIVASDALLTLELDPTFTVHGKVGGRELQLGAERPPMAHGLWRFLQAVRRHDPTLVACNAGAALGTLVTCAALERALAEGGTVPVAGA